MKLNRKRCIAILAMILSVLMLLPCLVSCAGESEEKTTAPATEESETTAEKAPAATQEAPGNQGSSDYIPPENYIDYENAEALQSTPNIGGGGAMVVVGGAGSMSSTAYDEYLKDNPHLLGNPTQRRGDAESAMRQMLSVLWTPVSDTTYSYNALAYTDGATVNETEFLKNNITLEKGKTYQGIPYTLGSANLSVFLNGAKKSGGVYSVPLTARMLSGSSAISARVGADDVDALYWAWASVAPSVKFVSTATMTAANGVLGVGEYKNEYASLADVTDTIIAENGTAVMYKAYAALQKADGLVADTATLDHAMMVVNVVVSYNPDGSINPDLSYVVVLEQTDANLVAYEALSPEEKAAQAGKTLVIGGIDVKYSFSELATAGYIPVTVDEFSLVGALEELYVADSYRTAASYTKSTIYAGTVTSNRRIVSLKQVITDSTGAEVINTTVYGTEAGVGGKLFNYKMANWNVASEASRCDGDPSLTALKSGTTYKLVLYVTVATGETVQLRSYSFTY